MIDYLMILKISLLKILKNIDNYISIIQRLISSRWKYILSLNDNPKPTKRKI